MRLHIGMLTAHCQALGLAVDAGKDFAIVWLGPRLQQRIVRRRPDQFPSHHLHRASSSPSLHATNTTKQRHAAGASHASATPCLDHKHQQQLVLPRTFDDRAPFVLIVYRHGAAVLLGPPVLEPGEDGWETPDVDAAALSRVMPLGAFYRTGLPEGSKQTGEGELGEDACVWGGGGGGVALCFGQLSSVR